MSCDFRKVIKIFNVVFGFGLIAAGVLQFFLSWLNFAAFLYAFYVITFGIIMLAGDFEIEVILVNMAFLGNFFGRGLFNLYTGASLIMISHAFNTVIETLLLIIGITLFCSGVLLIICGFIN